MEESNPTFVQDDDEELDSSAVEKLACYRCRQRKIKCNRVTPCSHCVKSRTQCTYASGPKLRERRQRVMVSNTYDAKLDAISAKIDELGQSISRLNHEPTIRRLFQAPDLEKTTNINQGDHFSSSSSFGPTPSSSSLESTPNHGTASSIPASENIRDKTSSSSSREYEGESSLFAHAVFARNFLHNAMNNTTNAEVAQEMKTVLDSFRTVVQSGKAKSDSLDTLYPRAKVVLPGSTTRNLPLPSIDKIFMCLRMARESPQVATLWLGDYLRPTQFNDYFIKIASPGPATEADLIIVHCGLFWLFCECSKAATDEESKQDFKEQAFLSEENLETVLANLRFHQPTNMDFAYAMGMASLYCLQKSKSNAAWTFINSASHIIQALGLQHKTAAATEGLEETRQKKNLFWTIYMTEKMLSLRLGRSSTFRDQDITLSRPATERSSGTFLAELAPSWIDMASIQGRIYNDIYSPGALMQPSHIRASRAHTLAAELKISMQRTQDIHDNCGLRNREMGVEFHEIAKRSDRIIGLSMLTLVYRSIAPETKSTSAFCQECINAARNTLQEHKLCVAAINQAQARVVLLEAYINWTIIQSPFIPFIVLFCHIIETSEASDLENMRIFVETLEATTDSPTYNTCRKQRRLFKVLYDVAAKYLEVKCRAQGGQENWSWSMARQQYADGFANTTSNGLRLGALNSEEILGSVGMASTTIVPNPFQPQDQVIGYGMGPLDALDGSSASQNTAISNVDTELDLSRAELWDWFNSNHSIMRILEDP